MGVIQGKFNQLLTLGAAGATLGEKSELNQKMIDTESALIDSESEAKELVSKAKSDAVEVRKFEAKYGTDPSKMNPEQRDAYEKYQRSYEALGQEIFRKNMQTQDLAMRKSILEARARGGIIGESLARQKILKDYESGDVKKIVSKATGLKEEGEK